MQELMQGYGAFEEAAADAVKGGAALYPATTATTVRVRGGKGGDVITSDGPFAETKEVLGGFYLLEAADLDAAIALVAEIPAAWTGCVEIRPIMDVAALLEEPVLREPVLREPVLGEPVLGEPGDQ